MDDPFGEISNLAAHLISFVVAAGRIAHSNGTICCHVYALKLNEPEVLSPCGIAMRMELCLQGAVLGASLKRDFDLLP